MHAYDGDTPVPFGVSTVKNKVNIDIERFDPDDYEFFYYDEDEGPEPVLETNVPEYVIGEAAARLVDDGTITEALAKKCIPSLSWKWMNEEEKDEDLLRP